MPTPSLWTDRPPQPDHEWVAAHAEPSRPAGEPGPEGPERPPRRRRLRALAAVVLAALLVGAGVLAGGALDGGDSTDRAATSTLPVSGGTLTPSRTTAIYERAGRGVVSVQVEGGSGTGFLIDAEGTIVTNAHVVSDSERAQIRVDESEEPIDAEVVGSDPSSDLAVLRISTADAANLQPLELADSDNVRVGDDAIAIGYPLGLDRTATQGIISGVGRRIEAPNGFSIDKVIQTDAPINPGNSGGPLLDARGRVIGVNSQIATAGGGGGNVGIGFAVPANTVSEVVPALAAGRTIERPYLGVSTSESPDDRGAVVRSVSAGSPAERAGLRAATSLSGSDGDVIVAIEGTAVNTPDDVSDALVGRSPGERIEVRVRRGGAEQTLTVEIGNRPASAP